MRIVGGKYRGRRILKPSGDEVRPTADRVRESIFDVLSARLPLAGLRVIDLFAGTGAIGLEAASRGASFILFVEDSSTSRAVIRANIENFGLEGTAKLYRRDATRLGNAGTLAPFDLALADPPYGKGLGEKSARALLAGGWLKPDALFVMEESVRTPPSPITGFELEDQRRYGNVSISLFRIDGARAWPI